MCDQYMFLFPEHTIIVVRAAKCVYYNFMTVCYFQAENIYNDEEPDTPASELEQPAS